MVKTKRVDLPEDVQNKIAIVEMKRAAMEGHINQMHRQKDSLNSELASLEQRNTELAEQGTALEAVRVQKKKAIEEAEVALEDLNNKRKDVSAECKQQEKKLDELNNAIDKLKTQQGILESVLKVQQKDSDGLQRQIDAKRSTLQHAVNALQSLIESL